MIALMNFWNNMINGITTATNVLVISAALAGIVLIIVFSIAKIKVRSLAVIVSTIASCVLMVPLISSFNHLVRINVEGALISEENARLEYLRAQNIINQLESERLENQIAIARQSIEIEALNDNVKLLENAQLSMQSFERILELALLQTNLRQTQVRKEPITGLDSGWGFRADYYYDEVLVIHTHDINAKFGIDLNETRISKLDENTVVVSGIRPKFIGADRNITDTILRELRTNNYKNGILTSVDTRYNAQGISLANTYSEIFARDFQSKLSEGLELNFMDDAVIQLAQNFIIVMFAPLYRNIEFSDRVIPGSVPITEYLRNEINTNNERISELRNSELF